MNNLKVSVIIPVFNGALFIEAAYSEIIKQRLPDFEIIFIDNNSTDTSLTLLKNLEQKDENVRVLTEAKQGAAAARNKGLKQATGAYIYFFDVDDLLFENVLLHLKKGLDSYPDLDSVFGNVIKSTTRLVPKLKTTNTQLIPSVKPKPYWGLTWMDYSTLPGTPSFLHRKQVFEKVGLFNTDLLLGEDAAFHVKLGMECSLGYLDIPVLVYYRHTNSTVSTNNKKIKQKVFTYWEPLVKEHIPYSLQTKVPLAFKQDVHKKMLGYIPKMYAHTKGFKNRNNLKNKVLQEIKPLTIPTLLKPFIFGIYVTGSKTLYKMYFHYILKPYLNKLFK